MKKEVLIVFFFLFISTIYLGQFRTEDKELAKTTFLREFNPSLIKSYLDSGDEERVNAALLSISHSGDTTFVKDILNLDFGRFGETAFFALGQIGKSTEASTFILNTILNSEAGPGIKEAYKALGKCGSPRQIGKLIDLYFSGEGLNFSGLPYAIYYLDEKESIQDKISTFLLSELSTQRDRERIFDALFVIYRTGADSLMISTLIGLLNDPEMNRMPNSFYILGSLRKTGYDSYPEELSLSLLTDDDWRIRCEAARSLAKSNKSDSVRSVYFSLLKDKNPNVSRTAARSLRNFVIPPSSGALELLVSDKKIPGNTRGEIFISWQNLYPFSYKERIDTLLNIVPQEYILRFISGDIPDVGYKWNYLRNNRPQVKSGEFLQWTQSALSLQDSLAENTEYVQTVTRLLDSDSPPAVSIICDGLDSVFISSHSETLKKRVFLIAESNLNDPDYMESLISVINFSGKTDSLYEAKILNLLKKSEISSVSTFAAEKLNLSQPASRKLPDFFDELWENSFKYSSAEIITEKGNFRIKFLPGFAPISTGNFVLLAERNYFDEVIFHRVVPDFVIQTGDPTGTGWGGPGYEIISEFSHLPFSEGYVGMASAGKDTEGSQWFVMHNHYPHLDGRYSIFGKILEGMDVVGHINQGNKIIEVLLEE